MATGPFEFRFDGYNHVQPLASNGFLSKLKRFKPVANFAYTGASAPLPDRNLACCFRGGEEFCAKPVKLELAPPIRTGR